VHSRILQILHNPRYAGAFVYGRTRAGRKADGKYTRAVAPYNEGRFRFTKRGGEVYAIYVPDPNESDVPAELHLRASRPARGSQVELLGASSPMRWQADSEGIRLMTPRDAFRGARVPPSIVFKLRL
jgi:hypothetical protein